MKIKKYFRVPSDDLNPSAIDGLPDFVYYGVQVSIAIWLAVFVIYCLRGFQ